jgi:hypothetical protein
MTCIKNASNIPFSNEDVSKYGLKLIELIKYLIKQDLSDVLVELLYNEFSSSKLISTIVKMKKLKFYYTKS